MPLWYIIDSFGRHNNPFASLKQQAIEIIIAPKVNCREQRNGKKAKKPDKYRPVGIIDKIGRM